MVKRDVAWLFRLLPPCLKLRGLLVFGPVVLRHDGTTGSLTSFVRKSAPRHGFRVFQDEAAWQSCHEPPGKVFLVHAADAPDEKSVTCRVVKDFHTHRRELFQWAGQ